VTTSQDTYLSSKQVALRYQVPAGSVYHCCAKGLIPLPTIKIGTVCGWRISDLDRFDAERTSASTTNGGAA